MNTKMKDVILTGLRANNDLHIGNYLGAILPMVDLAKSHADDYEVNMFVADLHSFITSIDHTKLYEQIINNIRLYVAAGLPLDTPGINVYRQSYISAHSELTWILNCFSGMGQMGRMTQYKDKASKLGNEQINLGLFGYPVLMAADILLYGAKYVPVGEDQTQHLEFTRDIAERMNNKFGELFTIPEPVHKQHEFFGNEQGLRIKDLQDPTRKMSKSDDSGKGVIFLSESPSAAAKKVMSATTDSVGEIHFDWQSQPGITNLLQILALLTDRDQAHVNAEWEGKTKYGEFKQTVAHEVEHFLADF
ncbi:tryptophan--tRNA ligase, partial [Candidatus Saccharibacteria bacterium]|nr:tryptophan--tRNA ligase [Candidatus Saccharibacteria bacterium]